MIFFKLFTFSKPFFLVELFNFSNFQFDLFSPSFTEPFINYPETDYLLENELRFLRVTRDPKLLCFMYETFVLKNLVTELRG